MICPIVTSPIILQIPSTNATSDDKTIGENLKETLQAHAHECVGMAANMIGVHKRIIAVQDGNTLRIMYNPEITSSSKPYQTKEGCLSLTGIRKTTRYKTIKVRYLNGQFEEKEETFNGFTAQIIQHEIDHCNGILIQDLLWKRHM